MSGAVGRVDVDVFFRADEQSALSLFKTLGTQTLNFSSNLDPLLNKYNTLLSDLEKTRDFRDVWFDQGQGVEEFDREIEKLRAELASTFDRDYPLLVSVDVPIAEKISKELKKVDPIAKQTKNSLSGIFKDIDLSSITKQFKGLTPVLGEISDNFRGVGKATKVFSGAVRGLSPSMLALGTTVGGVALAAISLGYAFRGAANEVESARQEYTNFFNGDHYAADALIESMGELEAVTYRNKLELAETAKMLISLNNGIGSINQASEYMKRLEIATGGSNSAFKKIPSLFQQIDVAGAITTETFKQLSDIFTRDVAESAKEFERKGVGASEAVRMAIEKATGSVENLGSEVERIFSKSSRSSEHLARALGNLGENMGVTFGWLADKLNSALAESIDLLNLGIEKLTYMAKFSKTVLIDGKNPYEEEAKRIKAANASAIASIDEVQLSAEGAVEYVQNLLDEMYQVEVLGASAAAKAGLKSAQDLKASLAYSSQDLTDSIIANQEYIKKKYPDLYKKMFSAIDQASQKLNEKQKERTDKELSELERRYENIFNRLLTAESNKGLLESMGLLEEAKQYDKQIKDIKYELKTLASEDTLNKSLLSFDNVKLADQIASALGEGGRKGANSLEKSLSESIATSIGNSLNEVGSLMKSIKKEGVLGGITGSLSLAGSTTTTAGTIAKAFGKSFESAPFIGAAISGVTSLFSGIVEVFGDVSQKRKAELESIYNGRIDQINRDFEREHEMRQKNLDMYDEQLDALRKQFEAGQLSAKDYFEGANQIGDKAQVEKLAIAKAQKMSELQKDEAEKKREYDEENSKWFPDTNKLSSLYREIERLRSRMRTVQQSGTIADVNAAKNGALQLVDKPTLFLAGEAGSEIVNIRPLKAGIDPSLVKYGQGDNGGTTIINVPVEGFIGDKAELGREISKLIQMAIRQFGEEAMGNNEI